MCDDKTTTTKSTATQSQTVNPIVPAWISNPDQDYAGRVSQIMQTAGDGTGFVAPASALQTQGFAGASNLGSWQATLNQALGTVNKATSAATPTYTAAGYTAAPAASTVTGTASGYDPALVSSAPTIATTAGAGAGTATASLIKDLLSGGGLASYTNPYTDSVVNTSLAGLDKQNGSDLAAFDAQAALNKSFGGSGAVLGRTNLVNSQALSRAQEEASLRSTAFDKATALAGQDASALTGVSEANAAQQTQASIASAQIAAARATAQAQLEQATASGNQEAANAARAQLAASQTAMTQQGVDAENKAALDAAGRTDAASAFTASADNTASQANQAAALEQIKNWLSGGQITGALAGQQADSARSDVATQLAAGDTQRGIDADMRTAPLTFASGIKSLLGYNPGQYIGQQANGTSSGTNSTTTSVDPLQAFLNYALQASQTSGNFAKAFNSGGSGASAGG